MKRVIPALILTVLILTSCVSVKDQSIANSVYSFKVMNVNLELWERGDEMLLSIPEQSAYFLPLSEDGGVYHSQSTGIVLTPGKSTILYEQNGYQERASLTKISDDGDAYYSRPQDPAIIEYPQIEVEIPVEGGTLSGYLSAMDEDRGRNAVILITGSGTQNRDEEIANHRPFLVISDYLVREGYATLRCDDRGAGKSMPLKGDETTYTFCEDVKAEVEYLRSLGYKEIILLGHSEGAMIAAMAEKEIKPSALILIGCPAVSGLQILLDQNRTTLKAAGISEDTTLQIISILESAFESLLAGDEEKAQKLLSAVLGEEIAKAQIEVMNSPWYKTFLTLDVSSYLEEVSAPTLVLQGGNDIQVRPELNEEAMEDALDRSKAAYTYRYLEGINHMMQNSTTGSISEYGLIPETVNERVLEEISAFLGGVN